MDVSELQERVYARCGYTIADQIVTPATVLSCINEANDFISSLKDWPWQRIAVTGSLTTSTISLAAYNWTRIHALEVNQRQLTALSEVEWMENVNQFGNAERGQPEWYRLTYSTDAVALYPVPTGTEGWTWSAVLSTRDPLLISSTDTPSMPEQYQWAIIEYASYLVFSSLHQFDKASERLKSFDRLYAAMVDNRRLTSGPRRIRIRRWW